jgi:3-isopropylmalate/(R)-2-methylmalate dehydratase small subunit
MAHFKTLKSKVIPLLVDNIDTDQILPARFLKITDKNGLSEKLFTDWRYNADGTPKPDFPINQPQHRGSQILLAGDNFGCGSSREHAPWSLVAFGIRAVISTSFADIFRNNSIKNGLLPVTLSAAEHKQLTAEVAANPAAEIFIDLEKQTIAFPSGTKASFPIDSFSKFCLLNDVDELEYLRRFGKQADAYESQYGH